jgi:hypothetical protein
MYKKWVYLACFFRYVYFGTYSHGLEDIGFETILDVGGLIVKNLTQEAKEYVNNPILCHWSRTA